MPTFLLYESLVCTSHYHPSLLSQRLSKSAVLRPRNIERSQLDPGDDSFLGVVREIIREQGITGLWLGIKPGMVLTVTRNPAITYSVYERLKSILLLAKVVAGAADKLIPGMSFLFGTFSQTLSTTVTYFHIMAKVCIQARTSECNTEKESKLSHSMRPPSTRKRARRALDPRTRE